MSEVDTPRPGSESDAEEPGFLKRLHARLHANPVTALVTKIVVTVVGTLVVLVGVVLSGPGIPGPGLVVVLLGLAILSSEWEWADRLVTWARQKARDAAESARTMDPAVRRRRIALTVLVVVVLGGAVVGYLAVYDWPGFAVGGWDRLQGLSGAIPELPGM